MIEALFNAIIVQPIELEETTYGNIVVPDLGNEKNKTGKERTHDAQRSSCTMSGAMSLGSLK